MNEQHTCYWEVLSVRHVESVDTVGAFPLLGISGPIRAESPHSLILMRCQFCRTLRTDISIGHWTLDELNGKRANGDELAKALLP